MSFDNDVFTYPAGTIALKGYLAHHPLNIDLAGSVPSKNVTLVSHADAPQDYYPAFRRNTVTNRINYLI